MALYQVAAGSKVAAEDLNQLVKGLLGLAAHPFLISGNYGAAVYPLEIINSAAGSGVTIFAAGNGTTRFFTVTSSGVRLSVAGGALGVPLTEDGVQAVSNKTISGASNTITGLLAAAYTALSVGTAAIADAAITSIKIANDSVLGKQLGIQDAVILRKNAGAQQLTQNAWTLITWDVEEYEALSGDAGEIHTAGSNSRIVAPRNGLYLFSFHPVLSNSSSGFVKYKVSGTGGAISSREFGGHQVDIPNGEGNFGMSSFTWIERLSTGNYREVSAYRNIASVVGQGMVGGDDGARFSMIRLGA